MKLYTNSGCHEYLWLGVC